MRVSSPAELEAFLDRRKPIEDSATFRPGEVFGEWRLTALIGKGGTGEVYRVEHISINTVAAIKILIKESAADHFRREAQLLSRLQSKCFPRYYSFGEAHGHLYYTLELLEPAPLPRRDSEIASFLITVAEAVSELHRHGIVHRDVKPQNILYRGREPVLVDFGLAERIGTTITRGSGTPRYAAPEQFAGGEISVAVDIHALGVLTNGCFGGCPPREWERIVNRSTSSLPARRYANADDFILAVKRRHRLKWILRIVAAIIVIVGASLCGYLWWSSGGEEKLRWRSLCHTVETDGVRETVVDLAHGIHRFDRPIRLEPGNYRVVGPGVLSADIIGSSNVIIRLSRCVVQNRTETLPPGNCIHYIVERGTYLNFANVFRGDEISENIEIPDGKDVDVRFHGPETLQDLRNEETTSMRQWSVSD